MTISKKDGTNTTVSIPNAAVDSDITEAKLAAFVDAYDVVKGGDVFETYVKAVVTTSTDTIIYPAQ